jgi:hypothetical protein
MPIIPFTVAVSQLVFTTWMFVALAPPPAGGSRIPLLLPLVTHAVAVPSDSTAERPFTTEQAVRGEALYDEFCAECHGFDLAGEDAKPLAGDTFMNAWGKGSTRSTTSSISFERRCRTVTPRHLKGSSTLTS